MALNYEYKTQIKIISSFDKQDFEDRVNNFNKKEHCFATQTHINMIHKGVEYVAIMFYKTKIENADN